MTTSIRFQRYWPQCFLKSSGISVKKSENRHDQRTRQPNEEYCLDDTNEKM
jgi:hypothetical protein